MRKFYSIVLMAAALLVGTNAWAATTVNSWSALKTAMQAGGEVVLSADIEAANIGATDCIWIGAEEENGTAPNVILNLAGHSITITPSVNSINPFVLSKGSLEIVSATPAKIELTEGTKVLNKSNNVFTVFGASANQKQDPKTNPFSHLVIGENVTIQTQNGTVIAVDALTATQGAVANLPTPKPTYATTHYAYGACVDVKGTLISQGAKTTADEQKCYGVKVNGNVDLVPADEDKPYAPYVHIHPSAVITTDYTFAKSAACYASGYAQWLIEGNCSGASGVYATKGSVTINNATVKSGAASYTAPTGKNGANGAGSAIVINSRGGTYDGTVAVTVSGDTKAESTAGYAMEEIINTTDKETNVSQINITGGTFEGGSAGAIVVTTGTVENADVKVAGGNVSGSANVGTETLADYLNDKGGTHATFVVDENGKTVMVISEGSAPAAPAGGNMISAQSEGASVKWTVNTKDTIKSSLKLAELEINTNGLAQELVIKENATFEVGRVVLGKDAKIIVEAGAKFIVTGKQGIVAPVASNIVLRNEEGKRSIFLFNPAVTSNKHPNATFDILSYSWRESASNAQSEVFGIPSYNQIKSVECLDENKYGYIQVYGSNGTWENIGFTDDVPFPYAQLNKPFAAYALTAYRGQSEDKLSFRFGGELVGNTDAALTANMKWSFFANSYTAKVDIVEFLDKLSLDDYVYVSNVGGNGYWNWTPISAEEIAEGKPDKLDPMQGFLLNNKGSQVVSEAINYKDMVYDPAIAEIEAAKNGAPARRVAANNNTAKMYVVVTSEAGAYDEVILRETENIKSAEKYMNPDVNIYATAEEKSAIVNAEDLDNTYVGFSTVKGGNFTISFANVEGREFTLVDHETGARVEIAEGNTYEFTAGENTVNDYRFEIVGRANMPTAIENTEAVKSAKGVYTITGQYVGEMNVWNALPAGVYVVNGEKRVK